MVSEMSLALLRLHTRISWGTKEIVVLMAAVEPIHSRAQRGIRSDSVMPQGFLQKNHAAMKRPMKTTSPRSTGCGTLRARLADV